MIHSTTRTLSVATVILLVQLIGLAQSQQPTTAQEYFAAGPTAQRAGMVLLSSLAGLLALEVVASQENTFDLALAEGTPVKVVTTTEISSKTSKTGDTLNFKVEEDVSLNGRVVIVNGTVVTASVINAEPAGRFGNSGKLAVAVEWTTTADGERIRLRAAKGEEGDDKTVSTSFLAGLNPFFLLRKGGDAKIAEGTQVTVYAAETKYFRLDGSKLVAASPPAQDNPINESTSSPARSTSATAFIYRPEKWLGYMQEPSVFVDDTKLARMDNGRYFAVRLTPGKHMVHMTDKKKSFVIDMGAGETYYFRVAIEQGFSRQRGKLTLEDESTGLKEIKKLKFIGKNKIKAPALVVELTPQQP